MSLEYIEGDLLFEFTSDWKPIEPWDRHPAYQQGIKRLDKSKAVDIIGVYNNKLIFFIEVKDYRIHPRTKPESVWAEFELKVRNTVAGLLGAGRRQQYAKDCAPFLTALLKPHELKLVLWIEQPPFLKGLDALRKRHAIGAGVAMRKVTEYVKWLDARVINVSQENDYELVVPGLTVKNLPRKRRELAEAVEERLRSRKVDVGEGARHRIAVERDLKILEAWLERAATVSTVEELFSGRP